ncbi:MAG: metallophosphoesterase [Sedimentisphaerales bacterium]|nr:metallophosphoesterase [Sedimentisphaerales bacterium]
MSRNIYTRRILLRITLIVLLVSFITSCASSTGRLTKNKTFTFVQLCDPQLGMGGYEHDVNSFKQAVKQINDLQPDFVLICGDLVHKPDEKSFADFNKINAGFTVPCYCAPGNHDVGSEHTLQYYRKAVDKDYYSFEHKGYAFVVVNTQLWKAPFEGESEKQDKWLKTTLETISKKKQPVFIVGHHPLFLKNPTEDEKYFNLPLETRKELLNLFEKHNVVAVLGGHTHKLIINDYKGIQFVNAETTSKNFDKRPMGFRVWNISTKRPFEHTFVPLENFDVPEYESEQGKLKVSCRREPNQ